MAEQTLKHLASRCSFTNQRCSPLNRACLRVSSSTPFSLERRTTFSPAKIHPTIPRGQLIILSSSTVATRVCYLWISSTRGTLKNTAVFDVVVLNQPAISRGRILMIRARTARVGKFTRLPARFGNRGKVEKTRHGRTARRSQYRPRPVR